MESEIEGQKKDTPDLAGLENREREQSNASRAGLETIRTLALTAARAALDVKAEDVKLFDMHDVVTYTDYMVLCTGRNTRLTRRIAEEVTHRVKKEAGLMPTGIEGGAEGEWILVDFLDFVVHVFTPEAREFYRLDVLWKQASSEDVVQPD